MVENEKDEWSDYRRVVLFQLEDLADRIDRMDDQNRRDHAAVVAELNLVKTEIGALKVKASSYGALAGLGAGLAVFLAQFFSSGLGK